MFTSKLRGSKIVVSKTGLFSEELQKRANLFKALAHPARLQILQFLAQSKTCITGDFSEHFPLTRATVNQHMKELKDAAVGHVKLILEAGDNYLVGNLTGRGDTMNFRGSAGTSANARLTLNARVQMSPETLEQIVRQTLNVHTKGDLEFKIIALRSLSPGRPNPTYRFDRIV